VHTITVGRRHIVPLVEAVGPALPAAATYPELPAADLAALLAATGDAASGHLTMAAQGFAIVGAGRVILVDTCLGGPKPRRPQPRPGLDSRWLTALEQAGINPTDVDTVINTHLHHDHVGWNTDAGLRPTFPAARYLVTRTEFAHATTGTPRAHIIDSVLPVHQAGQLELCDPGTRIDDEVRLVPAPGHTPGHTLVEINSDGHRALLAGDLVHHPLQLRRPEVSSALCTDRAQATATRRALLDRYADTGTLLLPAHFPTGGYLYRDGTGYRLGPQ
jgi:glyoxylase-like metal-dependent hydrolase (beta-lactamase superfamily II)